LRYRVVIRFAVEGDLRFISHHDTMRLFERAIARSGLPVRFSEGFNPRPRLSLPLPRAVGVAARADVLVLELTEPVDPDGLLASLGPQMPGGLILSSARALEGSASLQPVAATYEMPLSAGMVSEVQEKIAALLDASVWNVVREAGAGFGNKPLDLRPLLLDAVASQDVLLWTVRVTNAGSIRPAEFLDAVGLSGRELLHRVCRVEVAWSQEQAGTAGELVCAQPAGT
jgi:radical SAM-linked protein